jgi:hypothetical protein
MALAASALLAGASGCGGSQPRPAAMRLERADLVLFAHALQRLQTQTRAEIAPARAAWPALAGGLPRGLTPALRAEVSAAARGAGALTLPAIVTAEGGLTGPAAKLGGMLKAYARLTHSGWRYTAAALAAESNSPTLPTTRFLRSNSGLYIYSIYDGHYDLSLIGKALQDAYHTLGGAPAFGESLTPTQVEALAGAYSIAAARLQPHPSKELAV